MTNVVKIFYTDGKVEEVNKKMTYEEIRKIIGGIIQYVPSTIARRSLIVHDEGYLLNLPDNIEATKLLSPNVLRASEYIKGNAILAKS